MAYTEGFDHDLEFDEEATFGAGIPAAPTGLVVSDVVTGITISVNNNAEVIYDIGDWDGQDTVTGTEDYTITIDYILQKPDTQANSLLYNGINRTTGDLQSIAIVLASDDSDYYECKGCMCNSVEISCDTGGQVEVSQEYYCKDIEVTGTDPLVGNHGDAIGNAFATFSGASLTYDGSAVGEGIRNFNATINNNLERLYEIGSANLGGIAEGQAEYSGSCDVFIAGGGETEFEYFQGTGQDASIVINTGTTGFDKLTFANCYWDTGDYEWNNSDAVVVPGMNWKAETLTLGAV